MGLRDLLRLLRTLCEPQISRHPSCTHGGKFAKHQAGNEKGGQGGREERKNPALVTSSQHLGEAFMKPELSFSVLRNNF